jgi:hypothetical protein
VQDALDPGQCGGNLRAKEAVSIADDADLHLGTSRGSWNKFFV